MHDRMNESFFEANIKPLENDDDDCHYIGGDGHNHNF